MVNLIITDSYFNLFPILTKRLSFSANELNGKQAVFCEAKASLMIERYLCAECKGSFNTDVYSFGKFLREKKVLKKVLSKEGSAMAIKRILSQVQLNCFKQSKANLAPTLYDLIIQLKSAKVTPEHLKSATLSVSGILKNKLSDIYTVYSEYERYVKENGFEDQSSMLSYLPEVIRSSEDIKHTDVYLVGYGSFTAQMRSAVSALIDCAKSVTAILVEGNNPHVYVNETARFIREECAKLSANLLEQFIPTEFCEESKVIADNLFSPVLKLRRNTLSKTNKQDSGILTKFPTQKIHAYSAINPADEVERVAQIIRRTVNDGVCRYRDITVAVPEVAFYKERIRATFNALNIPYFLDEIEIPLTHPLVTLITAYTDIFRKGFERDSVLSFVKNPLFSVDKKLSDRLENYIIKYNINYKRIFNAFTFAETGGNVCEIEELRAKLCAHIQTFNVRKMLEDLQVEQSLNTLSIALRCAGENEQGAVTEQIYGAVCKLLDEMQMMLGGVNLSYTEFKNVFLSGISALKLSVIPQYNDAVFIGGYKECAFAKAKQLFAIGLTSDVPKVQADVALLSDGDINALENVRVLVEPKIRVVNHRMRERVCMALCAFEDKLYMSYPTSTVEGSKTVKSVVLGWAENTFELKKFPKPDGYMTYFQGLNTFAKACGEFTEGKNENDLNYDFTLPSSFYHASLCEQVKMVVDGANKEIVPREKLTGEKVSLVKKVTSPTAVEDYYKCPFRAFASHSLKIKSREEGRVNVLAVGNIMHEILNGYVNNIDNITDDISANKLFEDVSSETMQKDDYSKFISESSTKATVDRVLAECKQYCDKTRGMVKASKLTDCKTEVAFGDGANAQFPSIKLMDGKVRLKGKIDRVDLGDKYFRVLDYKTGKTDASEKLLFSGVKLQLYLYAAAVMEKYKGNEEKIPAGLYYLPITNKYEKEEDKGGAIAIGKTLAENEAIIAQDQNFFESGQSNYIPIEYDKDKQKFKNGCDRKTLESYIDYAVKVCDLAVKRLSEGVIKPSPYENACQYCEFSSLCGVHNATPRSVGSVKGAFEQIEEGGKE